MAIEQKFIVFNYVTSQAELSEVAPSYGDPNAALQAELSQAYTGAISGAVSLGAATPVTATVNELADPSAELMSVAQNSLSVSPEQLTQMQQSLGSLDMVGQLPATLNNMTAHATNVLENGTRITNAIDLTFQPDQAGEEGRCASLSDYIGSLQGKYNNILQSTTAGLNSITNALVAIPRRIIGAFTSTVSGLITAIQSGVQGAIDLATKALSSASNALFGGLGSAVQGIINVVGKSITQVQKAIQGEIDKVAGALADVTNNLFRLRVPNVNPCLNAILEGANLNNFELPSQVLSNPPAVANANLSFSDRMFLQFGVDSPSLAQQTVALQQARASALGISVADLDRADSAALREARSI